MVHVNIPYSYTSKKMSNKFSKVIIYYTNKYHKRTIYIIDHTRAVWVRITSFQRDTNDFYSVVDNDPKRGNKKGYYIHSVTRLQYHSLMYHIGVY